MKLDKPKKINFKILQTQINFQVDPRLSEQIIQNKLKEYSWNIPYKFKEKTATKSKENLLNYCKTKYLCLSAFQYLMKNKTKE